MAGNGLGLRFGSAVNFNANGFSTFDQSDDGVLVSVESLFPGVLPAD